MSKFHRFLLKRLVTAFVLTIAAVTIIFVVLRLAPGNPLTTLLATGNIDPQTAAELRAQYGLDEPLHVQYFQYLTSLLTLQFGVSLRTGQPVMELLGGRIMNSLIVLLPALVTTAIVSTLAGFYAGWNRGGLFEKWSIVITTVFRSTPIFITAIFLLMIFAYGLDLLPVFGMRSPAASPTTWQEKFLSVDFLQHYILPFTAAALYYSGDFLLLARNGVVEKTGSEFLKLHKAKGMSDTEQLYRAGRNSLLPIVTYFALRTGMIFQGLVLLEVVFAWPGVGRELVLAIQRADYTTVQAAVFIMAVAVILGNLMADILYGYLDPTVSVGEATA
ncbi:MULTISPECIES: ABC transporter permease [Halorussus]|uniref:ABC transporter permease n=1 Tax=Halorussus TaxID=1070314 RepID=UPI000E20E0A9|nr:MULTISPECIES: ABC transporter permease [Halorussus]NHN61679.1 ABC transporter permease [Halorussus sp. JP-T4]